MLARPRCCLYSEWVVRECRECATTAVRMSLCLVPTTNPCDREAERQQSDRVCRVWKKRGRRPIERASWLYNSRTASSPQARGKKKNQGQQTHRTPSATMSARITTLNTAAAFQPTIFRPPSPRLRPSPLCRHWITVAVPFPSPALLVLVLVLFS